MTLLTVVEVYDVNLVAVWPAWEYGGQKGHLIRIHGLAVPNRGKIQRDIARCKLRFLVGESIIEIRKIHGQSDGALVCDVHYSGRNICEHLYEYAAADTSPSVDEDGDQPAAIAFNL